MRGGHDVPTHVGARAVAKHAESEKEGRPASVSPRLTQDYQPSHPLSGPRAQSGIRSKSYQGRHSWSCPAIHQPREPATTKRQNEPGFKDHAIEQDKDDALPQTPSCDGIQSPPECPFVCLPGLRLRPALCSPDSGTHRPTCPRSAARLAAGTSASGRQISEAGMHCLWLKGLLFCPVWSTPTESKERQACLLPLRWMYRVALRCSFTSRDGSSGPGWNDRTQCRTQHY